MLGFLGRSCLGQPRREGGGGRGGPDLSRPLLAPAAVSAVWLAQPAIAESWCLLQLHQRGKEGRALKTLAGYGPVAGLRLGCTGPPRRDARSKTPWSLPMARRCSSKGSQHRSEMGAPFWMVGTGVSGSRPGWESFRDREGSHVYDALSRSSLSFAKTEEDHHHPRNLWPAMTTEHDAGGGGGVSPPKWPPVHLWQAVGWRYDAGWHKSHHTPLVW